MTQQHTPSLVHVTDMAHSRSFPINGVPLKVRDVVAAFQGKPAGCPDMTNLTIRLVNYGDVTNELDRTLAHNDTITLFSNAVANGGVKGAVRS